MVMVIGDADDVVVDCSLPVFGWRRVHFRLGVKYQRLFGGRHTLLIFNHSY
jgi:hypothetical protein